MEEPEKKPNTPSSPPNNTSFMASPEFEFWMVRNPAFPNPQIHSADELFVNGMLLPLHLLNHQSEPEPEPDPDPESEQEQNPDPEPEPEPEPEPDQNPDPEPSTSSKRWTDIFKMGEKKLGKEKKKDRKNSSGSAAELNINIWPFSRSRSAGNAGGRPRVAGVAGRKACSAPCSRSNSGGESKVRFRVDAEEKSGEPVRVPLGRGRRWPSSPGRGGGVHLGKSSPVRPIRRQVGSAGKCTDGRVRDKIPVGKGGGGGRVLNVNVPLCIGYRHHLSCNSDDNNSGGNINVCGSNGNSNGNGNGNGSALFNLRSLFSKKVY